MHADADESRPDTPLVLTLLTAMLMLGFAYAGYAQTRAESDFIAPAKASDAWAGTNHKTYTGDGMGITNHYDTD